ncbi:unnamed protein product [Dibothriocephalus latus]|uniref:Uncharacterized protein n=1 Tax=Dibothriocephalus latus TaxID=60516 RepID=A0A3P7P1D1_DIBLA|nr:unnamed protein product [Dibothriocephalus latus]
MTPPGSIPGKCIRRPGSAPFLSTTPPPAVLVADVDVIVAVPAVVVVVLEDASVASTEEDSLDVFSSHDIHLG